MPNRYLGIDVMTATKERMRRLFREGHRIVVSFSGGKDSTVAMNVCAEVAAEEGCLPLDVAMRDEEVMLPGTFEYCERVAERSDIRFHWLVANQPVINIFNREVPYFWVFDPQLDPDDWVRKPPASAVMIDEMNIQGLITPDRLPPSTGKKVIAVLGLRTAESMHRRMGLYSAGGYLTKENHYGVPYARPIYDWSDGDVWKAIKDGKWDYNHAYDVMFRLGLPLREMRIAPPTLALAGLEFDPAWEPTKGQEDGQFQGGEQFSSATAAEKTRLKEKAIAKAKTAEEKQMIERESDVYRLVFSFTGEEARIVKDALGKENPAQRLIELCRKANGGSSHQANA